MPNLAKKARITVLKKISCSDIAEQYMGDDYKEIAAQYMVVGQQEASYIK